MRAGDGGQGGWGAVRGPVKQSTGVADVDPGRARATSREVSQEPPCSSAPTLRVSLHATVASAGASLMRNTVLSLLLR